MDTLRSSFRRQATPLGHDDRMPDADDLTAGELEQLAQSLAIDGSLGRADTLRVVDVLRALAATRRGVAVNPTRSIGDVGYGH
jgi:hypothetical protein